MKKEELSFAKLAINIYIDMILRFGAVFINTYMVSRYDTKLLGAMSGANQIFIISITVFGFLSVGCSILLSQSLGANNKNLAIRSTHIALAFNFIVGMICFILAFFCANPLMIALNIPNDIIFDSIVYLKAMAFVIFLDSINLTLAAVIRTYGKAKELMHISLVMNLIGVILNACFLYGFFNIPKLGILGIGISSIIGRIFYLICALYVYFKILKLKIYPSLFFKIKLDVLKKILKVGGFAAGEGMLWNLQYLMIFRMIASLGSAPLSIQPVYFQISMFIFYAGSAMSIANEIIVGRLVGQGEAQKAYTHTFKALFYGLGFTVLFLCVVLLNKERILDLVNFNDELKEIARPLFTISIFLECSRTFNIVMVNALRASGDSSFPFYMGIVFMWGVSVPLAWVLIYHYKLGLSGAWIAFIADEFLRGMCNTARWKSKKWQSKKLV